MRFTLCLLVVIVIKAWELSFVYQPAIRQTVFTVLLGQKKPRKDNIFLGREAFFVRFL